MTPLEAAELLGLNLTMMTPGWGSDIRDSYAAAVIADHPDHGGTGKQLRALKLARDVLLAHFEGGKPPATDCPVCKGKGKVMTGGFGSSPCPKGCKPGKATTKITRFR